jgi:urea carboxylase system permease
LHPNATLTEHVNAKPSDNSDVEKFGYHQELERSLGSFSAFAAGFSYISILTGTFQTFYLGYGAGGPAFFWTWPMVFAGQFLVALCFAELAAHYPLSGGVYQWSKYVGNPLLGFMTGWIYLVCLVVTLSAVALALQSTLPQIWPGFQIIGRDGQGKSGAFNAVLLGCALLVLSTIINSVGVKFLAAINNAGVLSELIGVGLLIVLLFHHSVRSAGAAVFETMGIGGATGYAGPFLAAAALTPSYVMYGFDTAGSLAEETHDPRRRAPRAILQALSAAGAAGLLVLLFTLMSVSNLKSEALSSLEGGLPYIVKEVLGVPLGRLLLCDVVFAIFVCTLSVHTGTVRVFFAMARDGRLPLSYVFARVSRTTHTPVIPALLCGIAAIVMLVANISFPNIIQLVTAVAILWANLAYFIVVAATLWRRIQREWPSGKAHEAGRSAFSLGQYGLPINVAAALWSLFMVINVGWPRALVYGDRNRFAAVAYTAILVVSGAAFFFLRAGIENRWNRQNHKSGLRGANRSDSVAQD